MTDTATHATSRPLPPPLEFTTPDCTVCAHPTDYDGDSMWCANCGATWDARGEDPGWGDPDAKQCRSLCLPDWSNATEPYRCLLDDGHLPDPGRDVKHYNPDAFWDWTDTQATGLADDGADTKGATRHARPGVRRPDRQAIRAADRC